MRTATPSHDPSSDITQASRGGNDEGSPQGTSPEAGENHPSSLHPPTLPPMRDDGSGIVSSEEMLQLCERQLAHQPPELWGPFVRPSAVTLLVGEASAGKTVLLYNLAYHLAMGNEFLSIQPTRPLRVLSVDLESNDEICAFNLSQIGVAPGWDFYRYPEDLWELAPNIRGPALVRLLTKAIQSGSYDLVIVDSVMDAYPVKDENDNAEANTQMAAFRQLARATRAGVIVVHNAGLKGSDSFQNKATNKGLARGASARVDRADIVLNYTENSEQERVLTVVKSRGSGLNEKLTVCFSGELGFEVVAGETTVPRTTEIARLQDEAIRVVTEQHDKKQLTMTRKTIMEHLEIKDRTGPAQALDRALRKNVTQGKLTRPEKGSYSLPERLLAKMTAEEEEQ